MKNDNIRIVLVNTKHPGNIGSAARAMKTMGLSCMYLVDPMSFPSEEATALASGATDILMHATIVDTLADALVDCTFIIGASARVRGISMPLLAPDAGMQTLLKESRRHPVALIFGREDRGLTNEELQLCHQQVHIPSVDNFSSLNLAAAVQILAYELRLASLKNNNRETTEDNPAALLASSEEMEYFYGHLQEMLTSIHFFNHSRPEKIMAKLRRLYGRARPSKVEINILRGILTETSASITGGRTANSDNTPD